MPGRVAREPAPTPRRTTDAARQQAEQSRAPGPTGVPHGDRITSAFAGWDLGSVVIRADRTASRSALARGADAVTEGETISFARPPTLHTVAHEMAHIAQQRPGALPADVGRSETALEHHADAVADRVVAGGSVLDLFATGHRPAGPVVDLRPRLRRIPANVAALLAASGGANFGANAEGVLVLIERAMQDLTSVERASVNTRARGALTQAQFAALPRRQRRIRTVDAILALFPAHELGDPALIDAPAPAGSTEETNLASLAALVNPVFVAIASGSKDAEVTRVFGAANLATAKVKYAAASAMMNSLIAGRHVVTDLSLFTEEIDEGGTTVTGVSIALSAGVLRAPADPESAVTLLHEAMHAGNASVTDLGYLGSSGFTSMSATDKLNNAAHFEVVGRQVLHARDDFAGVLFVPAGTTVAGVTAPLRTPRQQGAKTAADALEDSWATALNLHRAFVRILLAPTTWSAPQPAFGAMRLDVSLPFWSKVERLTLHTRPILDPTSPDLARRPVSSIDIALSEGFTRRLGIAYDLVKNLETDAQIDAFEVAQSTGAERAAAFSAGHTAARENAFLLRLALRSRRVAPVTGTLSRDLRVVDQLVAVGNAWAVILAPRNPAAFTD